MNTDETQMKHRFWKNNCRGARRGERLFWFGGPTEWLVRARSLALRASRPPAPLPL